MKGDEVKVRRVLIEIEVPWAFTANKVLAAVCNGLMISDPHLHHQAQIVGDLKSPNTSISGVAWCSRISDEVVA
jgi:hypothetical protein